MRLRRRAAVPLLAFGLIAPALVSGCGGGPSATVERGSTPSHGTSASSTAPVPAATPSATPSAVPIPPAPKVGACYRLTIESATRPTSAARPVPCTGPHTAVTMYVGRYDPVVDGHLLAVDSTAVQSQIAGACPAKVPGWIGGSQDTQRLSRFTAIWFSPTLAQSDAGADWFRCDLVAVRGGSKLAALPGRARRVLAGSGALDRFGTCGTAAPSEKGFQRVACAEPHRWRAVTVIAIPKGTAYLGKRMQAAGDASCKAVSQQRATDPLVYRWSFEWPPKAEWDKGRRYGLCWVPSA